MKWIDWLTESNRPDHFLVGVFIYLGMFFLCQESAIMLLDVPHEKKWSLFVFSSLIGLVTTFGCMCSVEYIQKRIGGKWDWLDILAGCLLGIVSFITISILAIL